MAGVKGSAERLLVVMLRSIGSILVLAFPFALMPAASMASNHAWLGLGEFPDTTIVSYLTRSIALLYGFHGVLFWVVSFDVRRFAPVLIYIGVMNIIFGLGLTGIDLHAGMPWFWSLGEGPPEAVVGVVILVVLARARRDWAD